MRREKEAAALEKAWSSEARWQGVERPYTAEEVLKLRGSIRLDYTLAQMGADRLWQLLHTQPYVPALGALTGNQAVEQVLAGLQAIYASGWQVAADANRAGQTYPDQSLYPADSGPALVRRINNALLRADQIQHTLQLGDIYWFAPIVADGEAGFGGPLNTYELTKAMIEAGAAAVHFEDQISSLKKCGHMGGKVLAPASEFLRKFVAARLAADVLGVPTLLIARTDANGANLLRSDIDPLDQPFLTGKRTLEGYFEVRGGLELAISRSLNYAPFADIIWCETSTPDLGEAREFAQAIQEKFPGKLMAYNCSPSFNWKRHLDDATIRRFQEELGGMGYRFQFVTLAGFHTLNASMFELAHGYRTEGMAAYSRLQEHEFQMARDWGYSAVKHQGFVGAGYYDEIQKVIARGEGSTGALEGSTEEEQFET
ncbi:MAG: isocitrate lyase [Deltaproteobacteria bacterium]|nr:isocitrate lyase [Deltaproteobacteria bacterium]MBW2070695.1 isocitrate lyase [Deltaproteobacteria bacterium]